MSVSFFIVFGYIALMFVLGFVLNKNAKTTTELFLGKNEIGLGLLICLLFGETIAGASTTGTAQGGFSQGISAMWTFVGHGLGCVVFAFLLAKFFNSAGRDGVMSVPEAFKWRFDARLRYVMVFVVIVPLSIVCSSQCRAAASLVGPMTGIDTEILIVVFAVLFGLMSMSGLKGIAKMNVVNSIVIFFGVGIAMVFCVQSVGGMSEMLAQLPAGHDNLLYPSFGQVLAQFISAVLAFCVAVTPANACYSTDRLKTAQIALIVTGLIAAVFSIFPTFIGMAGSIILPGADPNTILYTMPNTISPVLSGIASMAVLSAVLSTAPFLFLSFGTVLMRDIVLPATKKDISEKAQIRFTALIIACFTLLVIILAFNQNSLFSQFVGANYIKGTAAVVLIVAMFWKKLTNNAAFWALLVSDSLASFWYFSKAWTPIDPFWMAVGIALAIMVIGTYLDKNHIGKDYEAFKIKKERAMANGRQAQNRE